MRVFGKKMTKVCIRSDKIFFVIRKESGAGQEERTFRKYTEKLSKYVGDVRCRLIELEVRVKVPYIGHNVDWQMLSHAVQLLSLAFLRVPSMNQTYILYPAD